MYLSIKSNIELLIIFYVNHTKGKLLKGFTIFIIKQIYNNKAAAVKRIVM